MAISVPSGEERSKQAEGHGKEEQLISNDASIKGTNFSNTNRNITEKNVVRKLRKVLLPELHLFAHINRINK